MKEQYHREITLQALRSYFQDAAMETIITANLNQDSLQYQIGHDYFHYDSNSFAAGDAFCKELRKSVISSMQRAEVLHARKSLGRLAHTVQDFYAHSNYVLLWLKNHPNSIPDEINPELTQILHDPGLHSGKLYYPLEAFSFISVLKPLVLPLLPHDSHAWMNIDDPTRPNFEYAFSAAVKRTKTEYLDIAILLTPHENALLSGTIS